MMKKNVDDSRFGLKNRILLRATHLLGLPFSYAWKAKRYEKVSTKIRRGNDLHMSNGAFELMMHIWHPEQFEEKVKAGAAKPLSDLTDGIHIHTVQPPDAAAMERIRAGLRAKGILVEND